jgi:hypothetical protein
MVNGAMFATNTPSIALAIGVREEQIERDPKALVAYLHNVDVGQLSGELNHGLNPVYLCSYSLYIHSHYLKLFLA